VNCIPPPSSQEKGHFSVPSHHFYELAICFLIPFTGGGLSTRSRGARGKAVSINGPLDKKGVSYEDTQDCTLGKPTSQPHCRQSTPQKTRILAQLAATLDQSLDNSCVRLVDQHKGVVSFETIPLIYRHKAASQYIRG
jgi:hypothetical protein